MNFSSKSIEYSALAIVNNTQHCSQLKNGHVLILLVEVEDRTPILIIREGDPEIVHTHPPIVYYVLAYE